MKTIILNDTHLGAKRVGGTTPQSSEALQQFLIDEFETHLHKHTDKAFIHGGDLFDEMVVPNRYVLEAYRILSNFLNKSDKPVALCRANHDYHPSGNKLGSWELLAEILKSEYEDRIKLVYGEFEYLWDNIYMIGHAPNQFLFDQALEDALSDADGQPRKLLLHANFNNPFAAQADHSLNVDEEQCKSLIKAGYQLLFNHEHQARCLKLLAGAFLPTKEFTQDADIIILGNQTPSSISDCLSSGVAQKDGKKYAHIINEDSSIDRAETWDNEGGFIKTEWDELDKVQGEKFVRVEGLVSQAEVDDVFTKIAKFRNQSDAFVVTNAVKVEGLNQTDVEDMGISLDDIKAFDVKGEFLKLFNEKEQAVLKGVMEDVN